MDLIFNFYARVRAIAILETIWLNMAFS